MLYCHCIAVHCVTELECAVLYTGILAMHSYALRFGPMAYWQCLDMRYAALQSHVLLSVMPPNTKPPKIACVRFRSTRAMLAKPFNVTS